MVCLFFRDFFLCGLVNCVCFGVILVFLCCVVEREFFDDVRVIGLPLMVSVPLGFNGLFRVWCLFFVDSVWFSGCLLTGRYFGLVVGAWVSVWCISVCSFGYHVIACVLFL